VEGCGKSNWRKYGDRRYGDRREVLAFLATAAGDLRAYFVCHARRPALQQRRIVRTIGYPRLHSILARSLLLEAESSTSRKEVLSVTDEHGQASS
jgi:hypothetical protein